MTVEDICSFYCLNGNPAREPDIKQTFQNLDISCNFYKGVDKNDPVIIELAQNNRAIYCMYGHINMIHDFYYNTDKPYAIICEDDIVIHKNLKNYLTNIIHDFEALELDILLLGYLTNFPIHEKYIGFDLKSNNQHNMGHPYKYHNYPFELWGTQMYLLSRKYAKFVLDNYSHPLAYMKRTENDKTLPPLSSDWTITKNGNRALLFPMLAFEKYQDDKCSTNNYAYTHFYIEAEFV